MVKIHLSVNRNENASPLPTETWQWVPEVEVVHELQRYYAGNHYAPHYYNWKISDSAVDSEGEREIIFVSTSMAPLDMFSNKFQAKYSRKLS